MRCPQCGRRGGVVTAMLDYAAHNPSWKWGTCFVPQRSCRRCGFGWCDGAAEVMLDGHRARVEALRARQRRLS